ncbi:MAG: hypothetical protein FJZ58_00995 [Chlamydiae bacterium]|nr:hypothetical protein [Chlamydiota bacterium]
MHCLLTEVNSPRKNKISLTDYDYQRDIRNRLLLSELSDQDLEVLEELLYSPLQVTVAELARNLDLIPDQLLLILDKIRPSGLFILEGQMITMHKEMRKYFETQMQRFDADFKPDMEFLQSLLKKPPIHVLPTWYAIPRSSDNIFASLMEKNFKTPMHFQRYIAELNFGEPVLHKIIQDVFSSHDLELSSAVIMAKYAITRELFEEYMLHLEFNFVCCLGYKRGTQGWEEKVTPFHEWAEYLRFLRDTELTPIPTELITFPSLEEYAFVSDLTFVLQEIQKGPGGITEKTLIKRFSHLTSSYLQQLLSKLSMLSLAAVQGEKISIQETGSTWLHMAQDAKAMFLYRHPYNRSLYADRLVRDTEKCLVRALRKGWVFFDDFLAGAHIEIGGQTTSQLLRNGRGWKYSLPNYTEQDKEQIRALVFGLFFEAGLVQIGVVQEKVCFRVTSLGHTLFSR